MLAYSRYSRYQTVLSKLEEISCYFLYTKSSASAGLFVVLQGGSICKNSAVLFTFWEFYGIITLGSYLLDKLEFAMNGYFFHFSVTFQVLLSSYIAKAKI